MKAVSMFTELKVMPPRTWEYMSAPLLSRFVTSHPKLAILDFGCVLARAEEEVRLVIAPAATPASASPLPDTNARRASFICILHENPQVLLLRNPGPPVTALYFIRRER
jgi:hypothetical protein